MRIRQAILATLAVLAGAPHPASAQPQREQKVRAAFVYNFALFTRWPEQALPEHKQFRICAFRADSPRIALATLEGRVIQRRRIEVVLLGHPQEISGCHVLYTRALNQPHPTHTLVVTDAPRREAKGAAIILHTKRNKMRFEVNAEAAHRAGLKISSKLLKLSMNAS